MSNKITDYKNFNSKKIEGFELINNKKEGVFKIDVKEVEPILNKTKTKYEFVVYDNTNSKIGIIDMDGKLTIFSEYKAEMLKIGTNLNSKKIVLKGEDLSKIKAVQEKERERLAQFKMQQKELQNHQEKVEDSKQEPKTGIVQDKNDENQNKKKNENQDKIKDQDKNKNQKKLKDEKIIESSSTRITRKDLMNNPKYKNVTAWTTITDNEFLDSVQGIKAHSPQLDKNSIVIAEVDNNFKILAKEMGTNRIIDLTQDSKQIDNSIEQVNRIEGNKQNEGGRSVTFVNPVFDNKEVAIRKTVTGQIEVERIEDIDAKGKRETIKVATDVTHPTKQEKKRAEYEKYGYNFYDSSQNALMTEDEIEDEIEPMIMEKSTKLKDENETKNIKNEIMNDINSGENPTYNDLEEIVEKNVYEYEETEGIEKNGKQEEGRTLESDALDRINNRKQN